MNLIDILSTAGLYLVFAGITLTVLQDQAREEDRKFFSIISLIACQERTPKRLG